MQAVFPCSRRLRSAVLARAQGRVPHQESTGLGFDVGAYAPRSALLDGGRLFSVNYDYYVTPRVSLRPSFGWTSSEFDTNGPDSLRLMPLRLDFLNRSVAFKGEGRYHAVQAARGVQPSGLSP